MITIMTSHVVLNYHEPPYFCRNYDDDQGEANRHRGRCSENNH
jgi:hypothetical protein